MSSASLPSYPTYTSGSHSWLGSIPAGWRILRGKYAFREYSERSETGEETLLSVSEYFGVKPRRENIDSDDYLSRAESLVGYKKCAVNDLAMNIMLAWKKGLGVSKYEGIVSPAYSVFRFGEHANPDYMHYLLRTDLYADYFKSRSTGIMDSRLRLYPDVFGDVALLLPSEEEQTQIAKFLDYETAKIDALIDKQQQLIALLKEKRQAVISHAVTKGLNPDAPMRDSGVEWLGEVPAHWDTSRLKFLVSHVVDCHHSTPRYDSDAPFPALRTADMTPGRLDLEGARRVHWDEYQERISRLKPVRGDIVYSREGERWGIAAPIPEGAEVCLAQRVMLFRANALVQSGFLMWALNSMEVYNQLAVDVVGATSPHVNISDIREVWLAVPPLAEQIEIINQIHRVLRKLDTLDHQCDQVIATLQERRTALISAAVTGKIDVRDWSSPDA